LNTANNLTLLSRADQTALIDGSGNGEITGNVTMQRYLPNGFGYKYVSSPFQNASVGGFAAEIDLTADFPTFYRYEENRDATGWVTFVDPAGMLIPMAGYAANSGTSTVPKTLSLTAGVNNGAMAPVALYNRDKTYTKGFNLVGNPYPSPIDWDAVNGWTRSNIDNAIYYFDAGTTDQYTGTYSTYINGISSNGTATNVIASMQGFFVHVSDGAYPVSGSFGMDNRVRVNNLSPAFHKNTDDLYRPVIRLSAGFEESSSHSDPLVIYFDETATSGFENELDAIKLNNTDPGVPNFYALSEEGQRLSIGAWPTPEENCEILLGIKTDKPGILKFSLASAQNLKPGTGIFLKDKMSGIVQDFQRNPNYTVYLTEGDVQNRFALVFSDKDMSQEAFGNGSVDAYVQDESIYVIVRLKDEQVNVSLHNIAGQLLINRNYSGEGHHKLGPVPVPGVYVVTVFTGMGTVSKKILVK
jgi:fibronectin-binding autotransporter adhesin